MLVKAPAFSRKPASKDLVLSTYQGAAKYDHLKKAAEQLMRQQHSDKTDFDIVANKIQSLEHEKFELAETSTKLLEAKVKLEAFSQEGKKQYTTLRFDFVATQTLGTSVRDYVTNGEKTIKSLKEQISVCKAVQEQARRDWDWSERNAQQEATTNRTLNSQVQILLNEKEQLFLNVTKEQTHAQELRAEIDSRTSEFQQLKGNVAELSQQGSLLKKGKDEAQEEVARLKQTLERQRLEFQQRNGHLQAQVESKDTLLQDSLKQSGVHRQQAVELHTETDQLRQHIGSLEDSLQRQTAQLQNSKCLVDEYQISIDTSCKTSTDLEQAISFLKAQLAATDVHMEEQAKSITDLGESKRQCDLECNKLKAELAELSATSTAALTKLHEEREATLKKGQEQCQSDTTTSLQRVEELEKKLLELQKEMQEKQRAHTMATFQNNTLTSQLSAQVEEAQAELVNVRKESEEKLKKRQEDFVNLKIGLAVEVNKCEEKFKKQLSEAAEREAVANRATAANSEELQMVKLAYEESNKAREEATNQLNDHTQAHSNKKAEEAKSDNKKSTDEPKGDKKKATDEAKDKRTPAEEAKSDKKKSASESQRASEEVTKVTTTDKRSHKKQTSLSQDFQISAKDVPTGSDLPNGRIHYPTRSSDAKEQASVASPDDSSQAKGVRKRKLPPAKGPTTSEPLSPKRVHFFEQPKKTYTRIRKAPSAPKEIYDEYTFNG